MKKFFVIPLILLYLLSVSGVTYYAHYCGSDLVSLNVYTEGIGCEDGGCGDESEEPDDCCNDKVITTKVNQDQNSHQANQLKITGALADVILPAIYYYENSSISAVHYSAKVHRANAPPGLWQSLPLYKLHSSFTYYG